VSSAGEKARKLLGAIKGFFIAILVVLIVIGSLYLYSGIWPPEVVIESASMQHSDTRSYIGVIDTGDIVVPKKIGSASEVRPYLDSIESGYMTYSGYGDVIIYRPLGSESRTPVIHRALCRVEYNSTGGGFDVPALKDVPASTWNVTGGPKEYYNIKTTLVLYDIGFDHVTVSINLGALSKHSGLITLGDNNNGQVDQMTMICPNEPVRPEWIHGLSRGELPWFGLLKLWISGPAPKSPVPQNSVNNLFISLALLIAVPISIDAISLILERKGIDPWAKIRKKLGLKPKEKEEESPEPKPEEPKKPAQKTQSEKSASKSSPQRKSKRRGSR